MRRDPGEWLRRRIRRRSRSAARPGLLAAGWICGALAGVCAHALAADARLALASASVPALGLLATALRNRAQGWSLRNMKKGALAEKRIGQAIEFALTQRGCAVAHHVKRIANVGDIDHLAATPAGLWVVETKYRPVPGRRLAETLRRVAENVDAVRAWAPGVPVKGCIVTLKGRRAKRAYRCGDETIWHFGGEGALADRLMAEAGTSGGPPGIARGVWDLGRADAPNGWRGR